MLPGPLFTIASYLGAVADAPHGIMMAVGVATVATIAIFTPGLAAALGALRGFTWLQQHPAAVSLMSGVNAGTVGLLAAACYHPIATTAITSHADAGLVILAFALLSVPVPSWMIVLGCASVGLAESFWIGAGAG